ncbi:MAG: Antitoxin [Ignavibacteria bacterium]|nr:Antitoxin [Ignavibacteria bacterium]
MIKGSKKMKAITLSEFQSNIPYYLMIVEKGTDIVIKSKTNESLNQYELKNTQKRPMGLAKRIFTIPDNFDDSLPEEIENLFYK